MGNEYWIEGKVSIPEVQRAEGTRISGYASLMENHTKRFELLG